MDIQIVQGFQSMGSGFMDVIFGFFYYLLNPLYTLFIPIILYYLFSKKFAYKTTVFYGISSFFCGTLKEAFGRARPYKAYPLDVTPRIESLTSSASMPSGHAMGSIAMIYPANKQFGWRGRGDKKRIWVFLISAFVVIMIGFSRVYMGAHYLTDVLAGWGFGLAIAVGLDIAMTLLGDRFYLFGLILIPIMVLIICLVPDADASGVGLAFGASMLLAGYLDHRFIKLDIEVVWWQRLIRVAIAALGAFILGIIVVAKIYESALGFSLSELQEKMPLKLLSEGMAPQDLATKGKAIMKAVGTSGYFLMFFVANVWAFIICPCLFKYVPKLWNKLFKKDSDKNNNNKTNQNTVKN